VTGVERKKKLMRERGKGRVRGGSIGCIEELWKRKSEEEEEERKGFSKSKKTIRSPRNEKEDKSRRSGKERGRWMMEWKEEMEKMIKGIMETCLEKWGEELKKVKEEREMGEEREEIREVMKEINEREERWKEDREEVKRQMKGLEMRMEKLEKREEIGGEERKDKGEGSQIDRRIKEIERRMEMKEKEERRKNLVIRGLEVKKGKRREAVEEILKKIRVEVKIKKIWRITAEKEEGREAVGIKVEETEKRGEIWEKKKKTKKKEGKED